MKNLLYILLFFPVCLFAQGTTSEPVNDLGGSFLDAFPLATRPIALEVLKQSDYMDRSMTCKLPNGETITALLDDSLACDSFWRRVFDAVTVREICNVPFGSSYEKTKNILQNKYGDYESLFSDKDRIIYRNKKYAGLDFNSMYFLFQSDGVNCYFNSAIFVIECETKADAMKEKALLDEKLNKKYIGFSVVNDVNEPYSIGGLAPIWSEDGVDFGLHVDIIKYDTTNSLTKKRYGLRLVYGPYNYVKEDF